jgi:ubiquitin-conjugating enzyme E2 J2
MQKSPPPFVYAAPDEKNILFWNYIIRGPPDSPYHGGEYHGALIFPPEYPFKPPGIKMFTPSGRFQVDKKICFSMSDFHPGTWNPAWSVATILTGLLSFMLADETTTGSMTSSDAEKRILAQRSHDYNRTQKRFVEAFPDYCGEQMKDLPNMGQKERGIPDTPPQSTNANPTATATPTDAAATHPNLGTVPTLDPHRVPFPTAVPNATTPASLSTAAAAIAGTGAGPVTPRSGAGTVNAGEAPLGWAASWRNMFCIKWRWGLVIALAVVVSRLTT